MGKINQKRIITHLLIFLITIVAVFLSMFQGWEMGGESWGYWYFAKVFAETGSLVVPGYFLPLLFRTFFRSPSYSDSKNQCK